MPLPFKVDELLKDFPDEREALEAFARPPGRTIDECHQWLQERGYVVSRSAVGTWKASLTVRLMEERIAANAGLGGQLKRAMDGSFDDVSSAAKMLLTNVVMEQASRLGADQDIDPLDVQRLTRSLGNLVNTEEAQRKMMAESFDREVARKKAEALAAGKGQTNGITDEQLAEVRKRVFG